MSQLPPCGVYKTVKPIGSVEAGRLVYFHNHGDPGPGVYLPQKWQHNRAVWSASGQTVPPDFDPKSLKAVPVEGFYRVTREFHCCEKKCTKFEPDTFVQLGYDGAARAIVFLPEMTPTGMNIPERGTVVDDQQLGNLALLRVALREGGAGPKMDLSLPRGFVVH